MHEHCDPVRAQARAQEWVALPAHRLLSAEGWKVGAQPTRPAGDASLLRPMPRLTHRTLVAMLPQVVASPHPPSRDPPSAVLYTPRPPTVVAAAGLAQQSLSPTALHCSIRAALDVVELGKQLLRRNEKCRRYRNTRRYELLHVLDLFEAEALKRQWWNGHHPSRLGRAVHGQDVVDAATTW